MCAGVLRAVKSLTGSLDNGVRVVKVLAWSTWPRAFTTPQASCPVRATCSWRSLEAVRHARASSVGMQIPSDYAERLRRVFEVSSPATIQCQATQSGPPKTTQGGPIGYQSLPQRHCGRDAQEGRAFLRVDVLMNCRWPLKPAALLTAGHSQVPVKIHVAAVA